MTSEIHDLFDKCRQEGGSLSRYRMQDERYFHKPRLEGSPGPHMHFEGKPVICWSINDYLGLGSHPQTRETMQASLDEWGLCSPMGSRLLTGNSHAHEALEARFAEWLGKESSTIFNYGYLGVIGTISALVQRHDEVVIDRESHACIYDGAIAATPRRRFHTFAHNDMDHLETVLARLREDHRGGILIVTEGVFGMRGDLAPLPEICALKERFGARVFVDDAHGFGVMGGNGTGTAEAQGVADQIDLAFGTFAKAFAAIGGVTAGPKAVTDWISCNARTHVFAKALPGAYVHLVGSLLTRMQGAEGDARRKRMWAVARRLQHGLRALGFELGNTQSPVTPVYLRADDIEYSEGIGRFLRERGIFVSGVTYPVVPKGVLLIRMIPTAAHSDDDVERTLDAFTALRASLGAAPLATGVGG